MNSRNIARKYNFRALKRYGQNFLTDESVLEAIKDAAELSKEDTVLEIGPGLGALTEKLLSSAGRVIAVEIDRMLIPILKETFKDSENLTLINADIMKLDLGELLSVCKEAGVRPKAVANLPYYITTPVILKLLEHQGPDGERGFESITVMVQKEVAERMTARRGCKDYGALSLAVQYYAKPAVAVSVPRDSFFPKPKVDSAVVKLNIYKKNGRPVNVSDEKNMMRVIRAAFGQRRKTLVNALSEGLSAPVGNKKESQVSNTESLGVKKSYTKAEITEAIERLGLPADIRGEALSLEEFAALSDAL